MPISRWLKARIILCQFDDDAIDWLFKQPSIQEIDELIFKVEGERGMLIAARKFAPDDYPWDYMKSPSPEPSPRWKYDERIQEKTNELKKLHRRGDKESYRLLGELVFPPQFN